MWFEPTTLHVPDGREPCKVNVRAQSKGRTYFFFCWFFIQLKFYYGLKVLLRPAFTEFTTQFSCCLIRFKIFRRLIFTYHFQLFVFFFLQTSVWCLENFYQLYSCRSVLMYSFLECLRVRLYLEMYNTSACTSSSTSSNANDELSIFNSLNFFEILVSLGYEGVLISLNLSGFLWKKSMTETCFLCLLLSEV